MRRSSLLGLIVLVPALALAAPPAKDAPTRQELQEAEKARAAELTARKEAVARAERAAVEEQKLAAERVATAAKLREAEGLTAEAAGRLEELVARRRQAEARLAARAEAMQPLLPLIQRLSLFPAETLMAIPATPEERLRGVLVLQGLSRQLEVEAEALRRDQAEVDAAVKAIEAESPKYAALLAAQAKQAAELDRQIADAQALRRKAETEADTAARRAQQEALRADSLRAALASIEAQRKAEEARAREEAARAEKRRRTEEAEAARQKEIAMARPSGPGTIAPNTKPHAQLLAPVAGRVVRSWRARTPGLPAGFPTKPRPRRASWPPAAGGRCSPTSSAATGCC